MLLELLWLLLPLLLVEIAKHLALAVMPGIKYEEVVVVVVGVPLSRSSSTNRRRRGGEGLFVLPDVLCVAIVR